MDFSSLLLLLIVFFILTLIIVVAFVIFNTRQYPSIDDLEEESSYTDEHSKRKIKFPSINDPPTRTISVIVPAYNEEERLPPMLDECLSYLEEKSKKTEFTYEVIIVDDGSNDKTSQVCLQYSKKFTSEKVRVLTLCRNRGKGGAVRLGMLRARGQFLLFADADGATKFSDYEKLEKSLLNLCSGDEKDLSESLGIVCGSRAHMEKESVATRSYFRTLLMYSFHFLVWLFTVRNVRDTQCGFKVLTRRTARIIFKSLHVERWAFDVEMLYMAQIFGIPVNEVAVTWTEIEGSKVTPVISWIQMGIDLIIIWLRYTMGVWKIKGDHEK